MSFALFLFGLLLVLAIYGVFLYNNLVKLKHNVGQAWSNIDVLLKQRHEELPKLIEACKQYRQFEQETLQRVTEARGRVQQAREMGDIAALGAAETLLRQGLGQIFAVVEAYPELKTNEHFMQLMTRVTALENAIADRREFYNASVNVYNVRVEQFPDNLVAGLFRFQPRPFLSFDVEARQDLDFKQLFSA